MALAEFSGIPWLLVTDQGNLLLNDVNASDGYFIVLDDGSVGGTTVRSSKDDIPQADGSILHRRFLTGYEVTFAIAYATGPEMFATCRTTPTSQAMNDTLMRHLMELVHDNGRILYTPTNQAVRLLDQVQLLSGPLVSIEPGLTRVVFTVDSPFPYSIDYTQIETIIGGSDNPMTLTNGGTAPMYPVFQVYGPTDYFVISNNTSGLSLTYDADLPGAPSIGMGDYAEFDMFRNTVYLNGDGANLKPGIDITVSDFFPLIVGDNEIEMLGNGTFSSPPAETHVLWQNAWL